MFFKCGNNEYEAIIEGSECFYYNINVPKYPSLAESTFKPSWNLLLLLDKLKIDRCIWHLSFKNVKDLHEAISKLVLEYSKNHGKIRHSHKFYKIVLTELNALGPDAVLDLKLSTVEFTLTDSSSRRHAASIVLPSTYPDEPLILEIHCLPISSNASLGSDPDFTGVRTISQFNQQFCKLIQLFQPYWDAMEVFDMSCWVIEPQTPVCSDTYRRIQLSNSCSALLTFNPYNCGQRPVIEFRGGHDEVEKYRSTLEKNLADCQWDGDVDIHLNLLSILNLDFLPMKNINLSADEALIKPGECGICFEDRLEGQTANQRCDNGRCNSQYHQVCLLKYLLANRNNVRMKNAVLGRCPTCRDTIGCSALSYTHFE